MEGSAASYKGMHSAALQAEVLTARFSEEALRGRTCAAPLPLFPGLGSLRLRGLLLESPAGVLCACTRNLVSYSQLPICKMG